MPSGVGEFLANPPKLLPGLSRFPSCTLEYDEYLCPLVGDHKIRPGDLPPGQGLHRPPDVVAREHVTGLLLILFFLFTNFFYLTLFPFLRPLCLLMTFADFGLLMTFTCCVTPACYLPFLWLMRDPLPYGSLYKVDQNRYLCAPLVSSTSNYAAFEVRCARDTSQLSFLRWRDAFAGLAVSGFSFRVAGSTWRCRSCSWTSRPGFFSAWSCFVEV